MKRVACSLVVIVVFSAPALADFSRWHGLTRASADHCQSGAEAQCCSDPLGTEFDLGWGADTCSASTSAVDETMDLSEIVNSVFSAQIVVTKR